MLRVAGGDPTLSPAFIGATRRRSSGMSLALSVTRHREDRTQETWIKVYYSAHTFSGEGSFAGWLFRIARNACLDYLRKRHRLESRERLDAELTSEDASGTFVERQ